MSDIILTETVGPILTIGLNRPEKRNALNADMFRALSAAYTHLCDDPELRCGVLYSKADLFSAGLDLMDMASRLTGQQEADAMTADEQVDPFNWASVSGKVGRLRTKPIVTAINGRCLTGGLELALATDILIAEETTTFNQGEVRRGLIPLGGAIERFASRFGWGNGMMWLLTGDSFDAREAHRIGLVQEIVPEGKTFERAMEVAERIASAAPLAVQGVLRNANLARFDGPLMAAEDMMPFMLGTVSKSKDLQEGIQSMFQKREPKFVGQ